MSSKDRSRVYKPLGAEQASLRDSVFARKGFTVAACFLELALFVVHVIIFTSAVLNADASTNDYLIAVLLSLHFVFVGTALLMVVENLQSAYDSLRWSTFRGACIGPVASTVIFTFTEVYISVYCYKVKTTNAVKVFSYVLLGWSVLLSIWNFSCYMVVRTVGAHPVAHLAGYGYYPSGKVARHASSKHYNEDDDNDDFVNVDM
jgi:hypothetical protein